ncbi:MAG: hypothetical protein COB46_13930 [Rhodospirillaceae bacterium]|nr:MAG: hypothetical protein COB46_13930 [Rhodospirillaceae bacterium]
MIFPVFTGFVQEKQMLRVDLLMISLLIFINVSRSRSVINIHFQYFQVPFSRQSNLQQEASL